MTQQPSTTKIDAEAVRQEAQELLENDFEKIGFTFGELLEKDLPPREEIIFGLARGEVGLLNQQEQDDAMQHDEVRKQKRSDYRHAAAAVCRGIFL